MHRNSLASPPLAHRLSRHVFHLDPCAQSRWQDGRERDSLSSFGLHLGGVSECLSRRFLCPDRNISALKTLSARNFLSSALKLCQRIEAGALPVKGKTNCSSQSRTSQTVEYRPYPILLKTSYLSWYKCPYTQGGNHQVCMCLRLLQGRAREARILLLRDRARGPGNLCSHVLT